MKRQKNKIGIRVGLYKSKTNNKGEHPLMIFITTRSRRKIIASGFYLKPNDWNEKMKSIRHGCGTSTKMELNSYFSK